MNRDRYGRRYFVCLLCGARCADLGTDDAPCFVCVARGRSAPEARLPLLED